VKKRAPGGFAFLRTAVQTDGAFFEAEKDRFCNAFSALPEALFLPATLKSEFSAGALFVGSGIIFELLYSMLASWVLLVDRILNLFNILQFQITSG